MNALESRGMRITSSIATFVSLFALFCVGLTAQAPADRPGGAQSGAQTIDARTAGFQKLDGYLPLYWDQKTGSLWMEISKFETEMLYSTGLTAGLGSNDIGLDRGQSGQGRIVTFQRIGPRVLMVQPNYTFRANSANPDERRAVEDAFAKSILWGFTVGAETDGRVLVDATDFFLRDAHNAIPQLRPGTYRVDRTRSAIDMPWTKVFPKNTEVDVILTFASDGGGGGRGGGGGGPAQGPPQVGAPIPGGGGFGGGMFSGTVGSVTPTPDAVTLREHHTFAELPDSHYRPRIDDPRAGYGGLQYASRLRRALGTPMVQDSFGAIVSRKSIRPRRSATQEADCVLRRSRNTRADPQRADRRRRVVEPGVHGGGLSQCFSRRAAARRGGSDGHPGINTINGCNRSTRGWIARARPSPIPARVKSSRPP
jgi:hypothetical protein